MGRYYSGDIEGKFWPLVQESDDASFFGGTASEPNYIDYYFEESDIPVIKEGIEECATRLGDCTEKLDTFFKEHEGYTEGQLADYVGLSDGVEGASVYPKLRGMLSWYARLQLGEKILTCVEEQGECHFDAEL